MSVLLALQHFEVCVTAPGQYVGAYTDDNPLVFLQKVNGKNQIVTVARV